ncbi:glycosyltransferase family 39 protein [Romeria aff. gracilis LEGE 07310]|uniref:Glycosyltransferase family 39 protein n=1 Tax=Vasconcelosia minhoensis LEGE 07310 TaxID=915328 RepID=A0A8J7DRS4_9CYAN|nr:glycosyltransferase family 39 protein [Romeria gracilis]MBE9079219.1 glycosyltransferase family 39 protein [Romeria aff. gracilis LEGE 07310]
MPSRYFSLLSLLLWAGLLLLVRSPEQSLLPHDEGYYALQGRWIMTSGDWLTVSWWGDPVYDRAIGLQWLIALAYQLFGSREGVARLPSTLACLGSVWLTYELGQRWLGQRAAWWGAAILAVTPIWIQAGRLAMQDMPLVFVELLGIWALLKAEEQSGQRIAWGILAGSTVGLGFLFKSFMIVLPLVALLPYLVVSHRRHLLNPGLYVGLVLGGLPPALWLGLSVDKYGLLPLQQMFGKLLLLSKDYEIESSPLYYLWSIPANGAPWPLLAIAGLWLAWPLPDKRKWLWLGYPLIMLAELSYFDTRTWYYPLQIYPFIALLAAIPLEELARRYRRAYRLGREGLIRGLSYGLGLFGGMLLTAGVIVWALPQRLGLAADERIYGLLGIAAGLGWLVPLLVFRRDRQRSAGRWVGLWQAGWLLGPGLAIATLCVTGLWGNYSPTVKNALRSPDISAVLAQHPVDFVMPNGGPAKTTILITFYTPQLGKRLSAIEQIPPDTYAWVAPEAAPVPPTYRVLAEVKDWQLVKTPPTPLRGRIGSPYSES